MGWLGPSVGTLMPLVGRLPVRSFHKIIISWMHSLIWTYRMVTNLFICCAFISWENFVHQLLGNPEMHFFDRKGGTNDSVPLLTNFQNKLLP